MNLIFILFFIFLTSYFLLPTPISAQLTEYALLEPLPLGDNGAPVDKVNAGNYLPGIFNLTLAIAGVLAVLRLIYAGVLKMSSDAFSNQNEAKKIIEEALWGLALTLGAWMIVATLFDDKDGMLDFKLDIPRQELKSNQNAPGTTGGSGTGGGGTPGCRDNCPYSYQTYVGNVLTTISYKDCASCSDANSFGLDIKHDLPGGKTAMLNTNLGNKLKEIEAELPTVSFTVTETWPPTSNHTSQKQYDGTAVDISLVNKSARNIIDFIAKAEAKGLKAEYEVKTDAEKNNLVNAGVPANKILVIPRITGAHFSVE